MSDSELFLAQYNQVWEQRRQHVTLIWTIPTVGGAVIAFALSQLPAKGLNPISVFLFFILLLIFSHSVFRIFLRHNTFQQAYGFLLAHLNSEKKPMNPLPQTGEDLFRWCREKGMRFDFWVDKGSKRRAIDSWVILMASLGLSLVILWFDLTKFRRNCFQLFFIFSRKKN